MAKQYVSFESIVTDVRARRFSPLYVLMGEEPFFIDQITELLMDTVLPEEERDFNMVVLYGADADGTDVLNAARRFPMMSDYQLVVVKEAQLIRNLDVLANYMKHPLPSTILVLNLLFSSRKRFPIIRFRHLSLPGCVASLSASTKRRHRCFPISLETI